ncbi:MAG: hypothetical protein OEZ04_06260 [Nitrospinota bacterium]|nr:hypothetical protein [Nitrospinota bacterium]
MSLFGAPGVGSGDPKAFHPGAYKYLSLGFYMLGLGWYIKEGIRAYAAINDVANAYPFFMDMNPLSVAGFSFAGGLYWTTVGLERSHTPAALAGYVMAGAHVLVFAIQVWLGPTLWALNNIG